MLEGLRIGGSGETRARPMSGICTMRCGRILVFWPLPCAKMVPPWSQYSLVGSKMRSVDFRGHGMHAQKSVAGESLVQVPGTCQYMTQGQDCVRESWMGALPGGALRATMQ